MRRSGIRKTHFRSKMEILSSQNLELRMLHTCLSQYLWLINQTFQGLNYHWRLCVLRKKGLLKDLELIKGFLSVVFEQKRCFATNFSNLKSKTFETRILKFVSGLIKDFLLSVLSSSSLISNDHVILKFCAIVLSFYTIL